MLNWNELVNDAITVRKEERLSQRELAAIAGVTPPTVIKFERGSISIKVDSALAILGVLGLAGQKFPKEEALDLLADLFSEGVQEIWNRPVRNHQELAELKKFDHNWQRRVRVVLREAFPRSEFVLFSRLGVIPVITRENTFDAEHAKILREYAIREERLKDVLRRYSKDFS